MKEYTDKEINNMILFLRVNRFAEFQYIDSDSDLKFYDYMTLGLRYTYHQVFPDFYSQQFLTTMF